MKVCLVIALVAFSVFCADAKDGQWNPKTSSLTPIVPRASSGTVGPTPKTYYSYSYKNPATTTRGSTASLADYAHKGATTIDSYKSSSKYSAISSSPSAVSGLNTAQSKATTAINGVKSSPAANAAMQAAISAALHQ